MSPERWQLHVIPRDGGFRWQLRRLGVLVMTSRERFATREEGHEAANEEARHLHETVVVK